MLTASFESALQVVVTLACRHGEALMAADIASATRIPAERVPEIMRRLASAGIVAVPPSAEGPFLLSRHPASVTMCDVADAVDPLRFHPQGTATSGDARDALCLLHRRIENTKLAVEQVLIRTTIAQLTPGRHVAAPACPECWRC